MNNILSFDDFLNEDKRHFRLDAFHKDDQEPLKDDDVITVYHGFYSLVDPLAFAKFGFSGKETAGRLYSYEHGNNPYGLFVTINFNTAKEFASSGIIMQASVKVSDLEAPVWVDGRSYYTQGEYTKSFESPEERELQRLKNREREKNNNLKMVANSDRPELAQTLFDNPERQALYVGDMNPNMIKGFWVNDNLLKDRRRVGSFKFYPRKKFIEKYFSESAVSTTQTFWDGTRKVMSDKFLNRKDKLMLPADEFTIDYLKAVIKKEYGEDSEWAYDDLIEDIKREYSEYRKLFHPKQLKKIDELIEKGEI